MIIEKVCCKVTNFTAKRHRFMHKVTWNGLLNNKQHLLQKLITSYIHNRAPLLMLPLWTSAHLFCSPTPATTVYCDCLCISLEGWLIIKIISSCSGRALCRPTSLYNRVFMNCICRLLCARSLLAIGRAYLVGTFCKLGKYKDLITPWNLIN